VRETHSEQSKYLWPSSIPSFQTTAFEAFHQIKSLAKTLFSLVVYHVAKNPKDEYWEKIVEKSLDSEEKYSQAGGKATRAILNFFSVLEIFNYHAAEDVIPCKYHSDIGMITIIPKAAFGTGLQLYDWKLGN
jgi:isopenicillin N synthase-like dioxygenase